MPGISDLVKGKVEVKLDVRDGKRRGRGRSDRRQAQHSLGRLDEGSRHRRRRQLFPRQFGRHTRRFRISTFRRQDLRRSTGSVTLSNGASQLAKFSSVRLNRGDDVAVSVKRTGKGYSVDISGEALDARSMVKQFTADTEHRDQGGRHRLGVGQRRRQER